LICFLLGQARLLVAPRAGAWIETHKAAAGLCAAQSHPVRVRGLKHGDVVAAIIANVSHPVRVRGLKHMINHAAA